MKPVKPSTAICQRPGTCCCFMPPIMNTNSATAATIIHSAELVNGRT